MIVLGSVERAQLRIVGAHPVVQLEAARQRGPLLLQRLDVHRASRVVLPTGGPRA